MAKLIPIKTIPFDGGVDLFHEPVTLPNGGYSQIKNFRPRRPGFESRLGQTKHHTANTDNTNEVISGYGFSKGRRTERDVFAQYSDGQVRKGTDDPPATTAGEFGSQVLATRSGASPASWANYKDHLLYADGAGQAQIYTGEQQLPVLVNVYKGTAMPDVPVDGADYLDEAIDGQASTVVVLDSLNTLANNDGFFMGFDTPVNKVTLTIPAVNGNVTTATLHYRKNDSTWASASATDGTKTGGNTSLGQTGSFTWTLPSDEVPHYAFGVSCFLYRVTFSAALDSEVEVSAVTGENTAGFQEVQNIWDGVMLEAVQALTFDDSATAYYKYSGVAVRMTDFIWEGGAKDYMYVASLDKLFGGFLDVGKTPNTAGGTIDQVAVWTGSGWTAVTGLDDGTAGGGNSGHITWVRNENARKTRFKGDVTAYWYRIRFSANVAGASSMTWAFSTMPYFNNIYPVCQAISSWDKRVWTSYNDNNMYGTATGFPMSINGDDKVAISVGDFRYNKILAMRRFHNFLLVWQEEKGEEGGGFHIIQPGTTAAGYAPQVISDKIGIMNSKCAVVLEDVGMVDLSSENPVMKGVFFLSRYGVFKTDGRFLLNISGGIYNYFDASKDECIRVGYEDKHLLAWDSLYQVLRLGIVSGGSATKPNKSFIYDYITNQWAEDDLGQPLSSIFEVEAASGDVPVLQMGGSQDGYVMRLNNTNDDISTAIDKSIKIELDGEGWQIRLKGMAILVEDKSAGDLIVDVYRKGETDPAFTKKLSMVSSTADYKGHRFVCDVMGDHLTIKLRNAVVSQPTYLLKYGVDVEKVENNVAYV